MRKETQSLPLTPFERYMVEDQKPEYPMSNAAYFVFRGVLNRPLFQQAYQKSMEAEPMFATRLTSGKKGKYWQFSPENRPDLHFTASDADLTQQTDGILPLPTFDLTKEPGIRVEVTEGRNSTAILITGHHALFDGVGILQWMGRLLTWYEKEVASESSFSPSVPDATQIAHRENLHITLPVPLKWHQLLRAYLTEGGKWLFRRPIPIGSLFPRENSLSEKLPPAQIWWKSSGEWFPAYAQAAKEQHISVNTLFLRDLFLALQQWENRCSAYPDYRPRGKWHRVLIPCNLRNEHHQNLPMANVLGYIFLDLPRGKISREPFLLKKIQSHIQFAMEWSSGAMFLEGLRFFGRLPQLTRYLCSPRFCHCSTVLSNLGRCVRLAREEHFQKKGNLFGGGLELVTFVGAPPVRPQTPVTVGILTVEKELIFSLCVDRQKFSPLEISLFRECYEKEIQKTIQFSRKAKNDTP
ncbi:MAG: condensation domain-containing protein [Planctomycetia bacterium]|nr:condensation domain-containing protein [Planctomycetia bacterium]